MAVEMKTIKCKECDKELVVPKGRDYCPGGFCHTATNTRRSKAGSAKRTAIRDHKLTEHFTVHEWQMMLHLCDYQCLACGKTSDLAVDHIVPFSRGGDNTISNIQVLCCTCNAKKRAQTIDYRRGLGSRF